MKKKLLAGIVVLTLTFALGYLAGRYSLRLAGSAMPAGRTSHTETKLGPWEAGFRIPGSLQMPDKSPLIRCDFPKQSDDFSLGFMRVTFTNLMSSPYLVRYHIYGYDSKGRRVSDGEDEFGIAGRETVLRKVLLNSHAEFEVHENEFGQTFVVQLTLEE